MNVERIIPLMVLLMAVPLAARGFEKDTITTSMGPLEITLIGHGTLMFTMGGKVIHIDPWSQLADYAKLPKADLILITHDHQDHLDTKAIAALRREGTTVVVNPTSHDKVPGSLVLRNGKEKTLLGVKIEAVPAYNLVHKRENGKPYHPKGEGNGYVLTFGDRRVYVAGDTENVPEMKALKGIDVAFLPMNLPYTMTPAMVADAARALKPRILYPYHMGKTNPAELTTLMKGSGIEVRTRRME